MEEFIRVARACADQKRVLMLKILQEKPRCVCEIQAVLGIAQPTVSKHLKILEEAGLVRHKKEGLWVEYELAEENLNPYAVAMLRNLKNWLENDPIWIQTKDKLAGVNRYSVKNRKGEKNDTIRGKANKNKR